LLYDAALLQSGFAMEDTTTFADRIHRVIKSGLAIDASATVEEEEFVEDVEEEEEGEEEEEEAEEEEVAAHDEL